MTTYQVATGGFIIGGDGELKDTGYRAINQPTKVKQDTAVQRGADLRIAFQATAAPAPPGPTARVSLVQIVQDTVQVVAANGAVLQQHNAGFHFAQVNDGTADTGTRIDQDFYDAKQTALRNLDPRYAQQRLTAADKLITENPKKGDVRVGPGIDGDRSAGTPSSGWAGVRLSGSKFSLAMLRDQPTVTLRTTAGNVDTATGGMEFEIAVLFEQVGNGANATPATWGGSIAWGWEIDPAGNAVLNPAAIQIVSMNGVSARFQKAINAWNATQIPHPVTGVMHQLLPLP